MKIVSLITKSIYGKIMMPAQEERLEGLGEYHGGYLEGDDRKQAVLDKIKNAGGADIVIGCWGTPKLDEDIVEACGSLKLFAYSGGSVKGLVTKEMLEQGIHTTTGAPVIAVGVAEFALSQILSFSKKIFYFRTHSLAEWKRGRKRIRCEIFELYGHTIGVVGAGFVGKHVIRLLRNFDVNILCYDPYLSEEKARELGVEKVDDLIELASRSKVITLHAPSIPATKHMIDKEVLEALPDGALLVNTARGSLINEEHLVEELKKDRIYACIDVTDPEPPEEGNPLFKLENVFLTPHIAGCIAENHHRQSESMVNEVEAFVNGKPLIYEVLPEMWDSIA